MPVKSLSFNTIVSAGRCSNNNHNILCFLSCYTILIFSIRLQQTLVGINTVLETFLNPFKFFCTILKKRKKHLFGTVQSEVCTQYFFLFTSWTEKPKEKRKRSTFANTKIFYKIKQHCPISNKPIDRFNTFFWEFKLTSFSSKPSKHCTDLHIYTPRFCTN